MRTCGDLGKEGVEPFLDHDPVRQRADDDAQCYCFEQDPQPHREHGQSSPRMGYEEQRCTARQRIEVNGETILACCLCAERWEEWRESQPFVPRETGETFLAVETPGGVSLLPAHGGVLAGVAFRRARLMAGWGAGS